jgi:ABC-type sugar transport system permease subunit
MNNDDDRLPTFQEEQACRRVGAAMPIIVIVFAWIVVPLAMIAVLGALVRSCNALMP